MSVLGSLRQASAKASVNLRGDLAKLSDAELAERLEAAWHAVDAARNRKGSWLFAEADFGGRGGVRSATRASIDFFRSGAHARAVFSGKQYERFLRNDTLADEYLSLCEVRDIMDEIKRRLPQRKSGNA